MKFECLDCHKLFVYAAKKIQLTYNGGLGETARFIHPADHAVTSQHETHVCPYCQSLNFAEYVDPQPEIVSVKSVDIAEVDHFLTQGYVVKELYAKTATLIKKAKEA